MMIGIASRRASKHLNCSNRSRTERVHCSYLKVKYMNSFAAKLKLKEMAEEDIYFAKLDQELIEALRKKKRERVADLPDEKSKIKAPAD